MADDMQKVWNQHHKDIEGNDVIHDVYSTEPGEKPEEPKPNYVQNLGHGNKCIHCNNSVLGDIAHGEYKIEEDIKEKRRNNEFLYGRYTQLSLFDDKEGK